MAKQSRRSGVGATSKDLAQVAARDGTRMVVSWQVMLEGIRGQFQATETLDRVSCDFQESRSRKRPTWWQESQDTSEYGKVWYASGRSFRREYRLCGDGGDIHQFLDSARQAGQILLQLPSKTPEIWKEIYASRWPPGAEGNDLEQLWPLIYRWEHPGWLWCDAMFELAWQLPIGRQLRAERRDVGRGKKETKSELHRMKHASCAAIDYLLDLSRMNDERRSNTEKQQESRSATPRQEKKTRRTGPGEAEPKIIAALIAHHGYDSGLHGNISNPEPIGVNELFKRADVASGTVSKFFQAKYGNHADYKRMCHDRDTLVTSLKILNGDLTPKLLNNPGAVPDLSDVE